MGLNIFEYKSPDIAKIEDYGFIFSDGIYTFVTRVLDGQFEMTVSINPQSGEIKTELCDLNTGEPYILHLVPEAGGAFVGTVRSEYERILTDIADKCFERDVFKSEYAHRLIEYVREKYKDELQYLWQKFPNAAVWRRKDNDKWYGLIMSLSKRKLGLDTDEVVDIIDLRIDPNILADVVDGKRYFAGYHMNKKTWITVCLDGSVPFDEICVWIDKSYALAEKS